MKNAVVSNDDAFGLFTNCTGVVRDVKFQKICKIYLVFSLYESSIYKFLFRRQIVSHSQNKFTPQTHAICMQNTKRQKVWTFDQFLIIFVLILFLSKL